MQLMGEIAYGMLNMNVYVHTIKQNYSGIVLFLSEIVLKQTQAADKTGSAKSESAA